jgi:prophage regulatory protein
LRPAQFGNLFHCNISKSICVHVEIAEHGGLMMNSEITHHRLIDLPEVKRRTGLSRSTIYNYIAAGLFPRSRKLGLRRVGWLETEINAWIAERPAA